MITPPSSPYANAVAPFVPLGRQPVGQENMELRLSSLKPMEQAAESAHSENRRSPEDRPNEVGEQERVRKDRIPANEQDAERRKKDEERAEQEIIRELAARDREVRAHEQAHAAVGGHHAGSPVYQYQRGPDGVSYAVGGEVSISTSAISGNPEATIRKAQQIARAAMAPAEPSPQDRRVAAEAARLEASARAELRQRKMLETAQQAEQKQEQQKIKAQEEKEARERRAQEQEEQRTREAGARTIDVTRRLADIGVFNISSPIGRLVDDNT